MKFRALKMVTLKPLHHEKIWIDHPRLEYSPITLSELFEKQLWHELTLELEHFISLPLSGGSLFFLVPMFFFSLPSFSISNSFLSLPSLSRQDPL